MFFLGLANIVHAAKGNNGLDAHGLSELTVAMDDTNLDIQFISPAMNLLDFEYKDSTENDIATVKKTESLLLQQDQIFSPSEFGCQCHALVINSRTAP